MFQHRRSSAIARAAVAALLSLAATAFSTPAGAVSSNGPWSATLYFGPSTSKYFGAVFSSGRMQPDAAMVGLAVDGRILYFGEGISFASEAQVTQYGFGHSNTTVSFGIGLQFNDPFGLQHTRISFYGGPSYAADPSHISIGYHGTVYSPARVKLLNYISLEYAVALSPESNWDGVIRMFHRSGAWGWYSNSNDDGLAFGLGVKYRFD